jgi:hypothetical protein
MARVTPLTTWASPLLPRIQLAHVSRHLGAVPGSILVGRLPAAKVQVEGLDGVLGAHGPGHR